MRIMETKIIFFTADSDNQLLIFREFSRKYLFAFWLYVVKIYVLKHIH